MKKLLASLFIIIQIVSAQAQSNVLSDKFIQNPTVSNPAFVGVKTGLNMTAIVGNQFTGGGRPNRVSSVFVIEQAFFRKQFESDSAKKLYYERKRIIEIQNERLEESGLETEKDEMNIQFKEVNKLNVGFIGYNGLGSTNTSTGLSLAVSYVTPLNDAKLYSGIQLGMNYIPVVGTFNNSVMFLPNLSLGAIYAKDQYFIGLSLPNLFSQQDAFGIVPARSANLQVGYSKDISLIKIEPLAQVAYNSFGQFLAEAYINFWLGKKYSIGGGLANNVQGTSFIANGQYQLSKAIRIGVTFNPKPFGFSNTSGFRNTGLLNMMVKFNINRKEENIFNGF